MGTDTERPLRLMPPTAEELKVEKIEGFRWLWNETGLDLPELAAALGRPLGTLTRYSHHGASSRTPPDAVLDAMDKLVLDRARALVEARGYSLVQRSTPKPINPAEVADEWQEWIESGGFAKLGLIRKRADRRYRVEFRGGIGPDLDGRSS